MLATIPRIRRPTATVPGAPSHSPPDTRYVPGNSLIRLVGWFSIGLGLAEIVCRQRFARAVGVPDQPVVLPLFGAREIISGIGILTSPRPTEWIWSRVAGDAMDLSALAAALTAEGADKQRVALAATAVVGVAVLDTICAAELSAVDALEP